MRYTLLHTLLLAHKSDRLQVILEHTPSGWALIRSNEGLLRRVSREPDLPPEYSGSSGPSKITRDRARGAYKMLDSTEEIELQHRGLS
jgi:hypothetical protein